MEAPAQAGVVAVKLLPQDTLRLLSSAQVITSVSCVVKELMENALDAGARAIQVKLDNFGLDLIQVQDDGCGVSGENVQKMFLPGCTSKISNFKDLDALSTFGFRGQALSAICRLGETSVTTRTSRDALAMTYVISPEGVAGPGLPSHLPGGTTIAVRRLFSALPVRKQWAASKRHRAEELGRVESVVQALAAVHPATRVTLSHNRNMLWQKNAVAGLKQSLMQVVGLRHAAKLHYLTHVQEQISWELIVPKKSAPNGPDMDPLFAVPPNRAFVFVNKRPVGLRPVAKAVEEAACRHWGKADAHVLFLASLNVPADQVDVNLEPNKTKVLLKNLTDVLAALINCLQGYYGPGCVPHAETQAEMDIDTHAETNGSHYEQPCYKRLKMDDSYLREEEEKEVNNVTGSGAGKSLCSQINTNNCTLTTENEVSMLNEKLSNNSSQIVTRLEPACNKERNVPACVPPRPSAVKPALLPPTHYTPNEKVSAAPVPMPRVAAELGTHTTSDWSRGQVTLGAAGDTLAGGAALLEGPVGWAGGVAVENEVFFDLLGAGEVMADVAAAEVARAETDGACFDLLGADGEVVADVAAADVARAETEVPCFDLLGADGDVVAHVARDTVAGVKEDLWGADEDLVADTAKFDLSLDSVSSQMHKKELSAFTKFARIMRPQIIAEEPNILFTKISTMLVDRWRALTPDEREHYQRLARVVDRERATHRRNKDANAAAAPTPVRPKCPNRSAKPSRPPRQKVALTTSLDAVSQLRARVPSPSHPHPAVFGEPKLIGQLVETGDWFYRGAGAQVSLLRPQGLRELLLLHRLLSTHVMPSRAPSRPLRASWAQLGDHAWRALTSLPPEQLLTCPVLTSNGFRAEVRADPHPDVAHALVTYVPDLNCAGNALTSDVPVEDLGCNEEALLLLKEMLELWSQHGQRAPLSSVRPAAIVDCIEREAREHVSGSEGQTRKDVESMLRAWHADPRAERRAEHCRTPRPLPMVPVYPPDSR